MSFRRDSEMIRAICAAVSYRRRAGAPWLKKGITLAWDGLKRVVLRRPKTPIHQWKHRLWRCRTCDLYDPVNRTCGHTRAGLPGELPLYIQLEKPPGTMNLYLNGCSCLVGVKASYPDAECYAVECGLASRWGIAVTLDGKTIAKHPLDK